jgi:hypothetical protein
MSADPDIEQGTFVVRPTRTSTNRRSTPVTTKPEDALAIREGEDYEAYAERVAAMGSLGEPDLSPRNPRAAGAEIDRRARELLKAAGVERPNYREYRDACAMAAAQLEGGRS